MSLYRPEKCHKAERNFYCVWPAGHVGRCDVWPKWYLDFWWSTQDLAGALKDIVFAKFTRKRQ